MNSIMLTHDLTIHERVVLEQKLLHVQKSVAAGILFCVFLGTFGAHRFYMRQFGLGTAYLIISTLGFILVFIPTVVMSCIAFVEIFLMTGRVKQYNAERLREAVAEIKQMRQLSNEPVG